MRGILAKEDLERADEWASSLEKSKREDIANDDAENPDDEEDESGLDAAGKPDDKKYDDTIPDFDQGDSSDAAPASPRGSAQQKSKVSFDADAGKEDGPNTRSASGIEFHHHKPIQMKDLPSKLFVEQTDKRTYEILSGVDFRVFAGQLLCIRRKAIEEYMNTSSYDADLVYVPHEYQSPIRHAIEDFYWDQIASEKSQVGITT